MDRAGDETGGIDVVFNNAGAGGTRADISEMEPDDWDRTMDLLLRSVAFGIRYAVPHMKGRKGASIVNVSSGAAVGPGYSPTAYAVAKAGVLHLTKCAATDLARHGIRVNAVVPGAVRTPRIEAGWSDGSVPRPDAETLERMALPEDVAGSILFLVSDWARKVTGQFLVVDGGSTTKFPYTTS